MIQNARSLSLLHLSGLIEPIAPDHLFNYEGNLQLLYVGPSTRSVGGHHSCR